MTKTPFHNENQSFEEPSSHHKVMGLLDLLFPKEGKAIDWETFKAAFRKWAKRAPYIALVFIVIMFVIAQSSQPLVGTAAVLSLVWFAMCLVWAGIAKLVGRSPHVFLFFTPFGAIGGCLLIGFMSLLCQTGYYKRSELTQNEINQKKQELTQRFEKDKEDFKNRFKNKQLGRATPPPVATPTNNAEPEEIKVADSSAPNKTSYINELEAAFQKKSEEHSAIIADLKNGMSENYRERTAELHKWWNEQCERDRKEWEAAAKKRAELRAEQDREWKEQWDARTVAMFEKSVIVPDWLKKMRIDVQAAKERRAKNEAASIASNEASSEPTPQTERKDPS